VRTFPAPIPLVLIHLGTFYKSQVCQVQSSRSIPHYHGPSRSSIGTNSSFRIWRRRYCHSSYRKESRSLIWNIILWPDHEIPRSSQLRVDFGSSHLNIVIIIKGLISLNSDFVQLDSIFWIKVHSYRSGFLQFSDTYSSRSLLSSLMHLKAWTEPIQHCTSLLLAARVSALVLSNFQSYTVVVVIFKIKSKV
jgi:hypothetical protein